MAQNFEVAALTPFARALFELQPGATGRDAAALLDHRAKRTTVLQWIAGRAHAPRWALQILADKLTERAQTPLTIAAELRAMPDRPGLRAGAINLARYRARSA